MKGKATGDVGGTPSFCPRLHQGWGLPGSLLKGPSNSPLALLASPPGDQMGECRAHGNLGSAFFSKGNYREALTNHRHQLVLAMKLKDREVGEESDAYVSSQ